ncbi:MAG: NADPH:quinone oxidoreductase family protein [Acetobacteraceae bacterium]|nr:NADPH:quinone oxidoreductase family protein [Acetobacteraceae bacterium]
MRAVLCEEWAGPERLRVVTRDLPDPGPGEVKVRVRAAGVNFPDVLIIQKKYQFQTELPFTPGAEVAGDVIAAGPGVERLRPGQRVASYCNLGGFAEEVIAPADNCFVLPDEVGYEVASVIVLAYGTSWHALLDRAALVAGETLLVLGAAGGVGLAAIDIAKAAGARVIAAASSEGKLDICKQYGADGLLNYSDENLREGIARLTEKKGPDVIYDPVGGDFSEQAFRSIAWRGRHLVIGFAAGPIPSIPLNLPLLKGASLVGVFWGAHTKREPDRHQADMARMLDWLAQGKLRPLVSHRYSLEQTPDALRDIAARKVVGKVVVTP